MKVEEEKRLGKAYLYNSPRENWDAHDPTLISEGLFAAANIFSTLKLIYLFTTNPHLGPLQVTIPEFYHGSVRDVNETIGKRFEDGRSRRPCLRC